ncbi:hypothetical protein ACVW1C_001056 [Bradyrhizobium sp. USDA 4011]
MAWTWRWWVFLGLLIPIVIAAATVRQSMNSRNVARLGKGDFLSYDTTGCYRNRDACRRRDILCDHHSPDRIYPQNFKLKHPAGTNCRYQISL